MHPTPYDPSMPYGAPPRPLPTPLRVVVVAMGACSPGGLLFLLALLFGEHINFDKGVWFILAGLGGVGGYFLQRNLALR